MLGLILTCFLLIRKFMQNPEIVINFLMGKYSRQDLIHFANEWFPMFLKYKRKASKVSTLPGDNNIMEQLSDLGAELESETNK